MRPEVFLDVADELAHLGGPGRLRSAISRAYYAVFHVASGASATLGAPRSNSHDVIGDRFQTSDDPEISEIGQRFLDLKAARHRADDRMSRPQGVEEPSSVMFHLREARALCRQPQIPVFDEATSSLDVHTEAAVLRALRDVARERTLVTIAHRLDTVRRADHVVVLERGRVVDEGPPGQAPVQSAPLRPRRSPRLAARTRPFR